MKTIRNSRIAGIGAHLPKTRVHSDDLMAEVNCRRFGISEDYISRYIGIVERRVADPRQKPSELAALASESALRDAGATADEIDLIVYTGITRDCEEPSTAHFVQSQLGASNAVCMDASNACLGFMTGLSIAHSFIATGAASTALVCSGECQSNTVKEFLDALTRTTDKREFKTMFGVLTVGDAGGAMIIRPEDTHQTGWQHLNFQSNGDHARLCYFERTPAGPVGAMLMQNISTQVINMHASEMQLTYSALDWSPASVDKLYCHQVGKKPHELLTQVSGVDIELAPITYNHFGNLTSTTIPVNMYLNRPQPGDRLLFLGAGSGLTICQGAMIF